MSVITNPADLVSLRAVPRRLLAVFAHPDDEAYGCAGALARAGADPDAVAVLLTLTSGESSSLAPGMGLSPAEMGRLREARLARVAEITGLGGQLLAHGPDRRLSREPLERVAEPIREVLAAFSPGVVVTHCPRGVNGHPDHIAAHWAVRRALESTPGQAGVRLAMTAYPPALTADIPRLIFSTGEDELDAILELSAEEAARKEECLRVHDALVTLRDDADESLFRRPPLEHFDFLGEDFTPPLADLFEKLA